MREPDPSSWTQALPLADLRDRGRAVVKLGDRQIAVFAVGDHIYACNNRCPHEGYPLVEGHVDGAPGECRLTCNWHNWKFELDTGANVYGGDALRLYPTRVADGAVWLDLADRPQAERVALARANLQNAMDDYQYDRIAREIARLEKSGADPASAVAQAIVSSHTRLRDGMTHAYAATNAWLRLHDRSQDPAERLTCLAESVGHIAWDTLREPAWPYAGTTPLPWDARHFAAAVEAQDEDRALALARGAIASGLGLPGIEPALAQAALAHYNDFGHSAIYLEACLELVARLGREVELPLTLTYVRSLVRATREDLIPDYRRYAQALQAWRASAPEGSPPDLDPAAWVGASIRGALDETLARRAAAPLALHRALLGAGAVHLLRFDASHEQRVDVGVADNIGWLDFTHAITFANALRRLCTRRPELWPEALLQMALFVGRNSPYLAPADAPSVPMDRTTFDATCRARVLNHGTGLYIFAAHLLKTWLAASDEIAAGVPPAVEQALMASVVRYLGASLHQKSTVRTARQALKFVALED